jgi:hypothetical protein
MTTEIAGTKRRWGSVVRIGLTVVICLVAAAGIYVRSLTKSRATPPPALPVPNGYDDLVRAGKKLQGEIPNVGKLQQAEIGPIRDWVALNAEAIQLGRSALERESRVPLVYSQDMSEHLDRGSACRQLARAITAEGELALVEGRPDDAGRIFLDVARLGPSAGRGGLLIDGLIGVAVERTGLDGLSRSRKGMSREALRRAIASLREIDANRDSFADMRNQETYWFEHTFPLHTRLMVKVSGAMEKLNAPAYKSADGALGLVKIMNRQLMVDLATQLYVLDHKSEPAQPSDLVPDYLTELPKNPTTGDPITAK